MTPTDLPPALALRMMAAGSAVTQTLFATVELKLCDALAGGARTAEAIAPALGAHAPFLYRLMRALAALGVLAEDDAHGFTLTELGQLLRSDVPGSMRNAVLMLGSTPHYPAWTGLTHALRTGECAFDAVLGKPIFEWYADHPEPARVFDASMAANTAVVARAVAAAYDFARFSTVMDLGGGVGALLAAILEAHPSVRGVLADQPQVLERALPFLEARGLAARVERTPVNFFSTVPAVADAYVMKSILHDWDDARAIAILRVVRAAIGDRGAPLLVVELVLDPRAPQSMPAMMDLTMMVMTGGTERTVDQWRALLAAGGFAMGRVLPAAFASVIEALPA